MIHVWNIWISVGIELSDESHGLIGSNQNGVFPTRFARFRRCSIAIQNQKLNIMNVKRVGLAPAVHNFPDLDIA